MGAARAGGAMTTAEHMRAEQRPDVYHGESCDGRRPRWIVDTRSGPDEAGDEGILKLDCRTFPPGTAVIVSFPECPSCDLPAKDPVGGKVEPCACGFDWENWAGEYYS